MKARLEAPYKTSWGWLWLPALGLVGIIISVGISSTEKLESDPRYLAIGSCQESVRERLKAPSTAEFPENRRSLMTNPDNPQGLVVTGVVDAENAFGAKLRQRYACEVRIVGERAVTDQVEISPAAP